MAKTKELSKDVRDKIVDLEWATRPSASSLVRRWQQLVWLFANGRNTKKKTINLPRTGAPCKISPRGVSVIMRTVRNKPRTTREDLINKLNAAGTIVNKKTIGNTTPWRTKILQCPQGPPAQESTCTGPSEVCQWFRGELGESVVVRWDQNPPLWHQLNSPCLEEKECCLWPQEHHGSWKWVVFGYSSMTMTQNTRPRQQRSGSRSTLRSWSGLVSLH